MRTLVQCVCVCVCVMVFISVPIDHSFLPAGIGVEMAASSMER